MGGYGVMSKPEILTHPSRFRIEIGLLTDFLESISEGELVPYEKLNEVSGINLKNNYHVLQVARKEIHKEKNVVFGVIKNVGIKRLSSDEISGVGISTVKS